MIFNIAWAALIFTTICISIVNWILVSRLAEKYPLVYEEMGRPGTLFFIVGNWFVPHRFVRALISGHLLRLLFEKSDLRWLVMADSELAVLLYSSWIAGLVSLIFNI
jgi:hypothetical protein